MYLHCCSKVEECWYKINSSNLTGQNIMLGNSRNDNIYANHASDNLFSPLKPQTAVTKLSGSGCLTLFAKLTEKKGENMLSFWQAKT